MIYELGTLPGVEEDVDSAVSWYEEKREGLGYELLACIDYCFDSITRHPLAYEQIYKDVRRALIHRFPYCVYFVAIDGKVMVFAVLHAKQHHSNWRLRNRE